MSLKPKEKQLTGGKIGAEVRLSFRAEFSPKGDPMPAPEPYR